MRLTRKAKFKSVGQIEPLNCLPYLKPFNCVQTNTQY